MRASFFFFVVVVVIVAGCEDPEARLDRVREEAAVCVDGDVCVVAGGSDCVCGVPVNESAVDEVEAAADAVACCDAFGGCVAVDCAAFVDVRCEEGRCVGDSG